MIDRTAAQTVFSSFCSTHVHTRTHKNAHGTSTKIHVRTQNSGSDTLMSNLEIQIAKHLHTHTSSIKHRCTHANARIHAASLPVTSEHLSEVLTLAKLLLWRTKGQRVVLILLTRIGKRSHLQRIKHTYQQENIAHATSAFLRLGRTLSQDLIFRITPRPRTTRLGKLRLLCAIFQEMKLKQCVNKALLCPTVSPSVKCVRGCGVLKQTACDKKVACTLLAKSGTCSPFLYLVDCAAPGNACSASDTAASHTNALMPLAAWSRRLRLNLKI